MRVYWSLRRWLGLPSRLALLLGLGALSAAGARADAALDRPGAGGAPIPHDNPASVGPASRGPASSGPANGGELLIRAEGGRLYLAEGGGEFQELRLRDMPEAVLLKQLVEGNGAGAAGIRLGPMILAGAGGDGFHWPPGGRPATRANPAPAGSSNPAAGVPAQAAPPAQATPPQNSGAPRKATTGRTGEKS
jgi:hypothetical protein